MTLSLPALEARVSALLAALDQEIRLLTQRQAQLERMSEAILRHDEDRLEDLLGEMQQALDDQARADRRLRQAQAALAQALGCGSRPVRLRLLAQRLAGRQRAQLESRRRRIVALALDVRRQHLRTIVLVRECARINRLLLETIFPGSREVETYTAGGAERWRPNTGLVNAER